MPEQKPSPFFEAVQNYVRLTRAYRKEMTISSLYINAMQILQVFEPILVAAIMADMIAHREHLIELISMRTGITLVLIVTVSVIGRKKSVYVRTLIEGMTNRLYVQMFDKLLRLSGTFHETHNTTELHGTISQGVIRLADITFLLASDLAPLMTMFVATSVAISYYSGASTLVIVPVVAMFVGATIAVRSRMAKHRRERHALNKSIHRFFGASVIMVRTIWSFARERTELSHFHDMLERTTAMLMKEYKSYDALDLWRNILVGVGRTTVLIICVWQALHDPSRLASLYLVVSLATTLFKACYNIGNVYDRFIESSESVRMLIEIVDEQLTIVDPEDPVVMTKVHGEIHLQDVCFAYESNPNKLALDHLTLTIRAGEKIGLIGESGGGKSTFTKALLRFINLTSGSILIDGINISRLTLKQLRESIGYVAQDIEIFDGTIAENIGYGKEGATMEEIMEAARKAHAHQFILSLPDGYATRVGDRGLRLSGGQRQRVGIARVFLKDAPIILFDEATSNVDAASDTEIHASVADLVAGGKTVLVIAHRLDTVRNADRLVYIQDGKIVEVGPPKELERKGGYYAKLLRKHEALGKEAVSSVN